MNNHELARLLVAATPTATGLQYNNASEAYRAVDAYPSSIMMRELVARARREYLASINREVDKRPASQHPYFHGQVAAAVVFEFLTVRGVIRPLSSITSSLRDDATRLGIEADTPAQLADQYIICGWAYTHAFVTPGDAVLDAVSFYEHLWHAGRRIGLDPTQIARIARHERPWAYRTYYTRVPVEIYRHTQSCATPRTVLTGRCGYSGCIKPSLPADKCDGLGLCDRHFKRARKILARRFHQHTPTM